MMAVCWAPLLLMGAALTVQTPWHQTTQMDAGIVEVQTCEKGWGLDAKASTQGVYGADVQYGFVYHTGEWMLGLLPKGGVSYVDHPVYELPSRTQFGVGAQALLGYGRARLGVEYWHLSNAFTRDPNIGMDLLLIQTGWRF